MKILLTGIGHYSRLFVFINRLGYRKDTKRTPICYNSSAFYKIIFVLPKTPPQNLAKPGNILKQKFFNCKIRKPIPH
jgi:hypothetical protein